MSGHSHARTIKHAKELTDAKKGQAFSKMARVIGIAAKEGGGDPNTNSKLRLAIEQAKSINMPKDNVERAIKRGTGELAGEKLEKVIFEAYGPGGIAIIIEGITDNKNRAHNEIKQILNQYNGKLAGEGSVRWMFERKGAIIVNNKQKIPMAKPSRILDVDRVEHSRQSRNKVGTINKDNLELLAIEAGAEDIYWREDFLDIYTKLEELEKVKKSLEEKRIKIDSSSLDWAAKEMIEVDKKNKENCQKLFEALDENEAVQDIYSNLKL